jgi:hypothetical protein
MQVVRVFRSVSQYLEDDPRQSGTTGPLVKDYLLQDSKRSCNYKILHYGQIIAYTLNAKVSL